MPDFVNQPHQHIKTDQRLDSRAAEIAAGRPPEIKCGLAAGKIAASHQPGRKKILAKPPTNVRLSHAMLTTQLTINIQSSYDHAAKLQHDRSEQDSNSMGDRDL